MSQQNSVTPATLELLKTITVFADHLLKYFKPLPSTIFFLNFYNGLT